ARALMDDALRRWTAIPGYASSPLHSILGDVAERLGDRRRALEYFAAGMDEVHWLGQSEIVGRMLRRIGLLLVTEDPETAALLFGAGTKPSKALTLARRVT